MATRLTDTFIRALTKPGDYGDKACQGLVLRVSKAGTRQWLFRGTVDGVRTKKGLGGYPSTSLKEARAKAIANRELNDAGLLTTGKTSSKTIPTFSEACVKAASVRFPTPTAHSVEWLGSLQRHAIPTLGKMPVNEIEPSHVITCLETIWNEKPVTAQHVRNRIGRVMAFSLSHGHCERNVCDGIDAALPLPKREVVHHRCLPYENLPEAMTAIRGCKTMLSAKLAVELLILCASRSAEIRGCLWSEIDLEARTWTIPRQRMKGDVEHVIPLTDAAVDVLEQAKPLRNASDLVFPSARTGRQMSAIALTAVLKAVGIHGEATIHGFRSCFRDFAENKSGAPHNVAEAALAHVVGNSTTRAYLRTNHMVRRVKLMNEWNEFCAGG